jgi:TIR domain
MPEAKVPGAKPKIFITHSHRDNQFATQIFNDLHAQGLDGFFDINSLKGGDRIAEEIDRGLKGCDIYIPILSFASLKSPWCREEIYGALTLRGCFKSPYFCGARRLSIK